MENNQPDKRGFDVSGTHAHAILIVCTLLYMVNYMDRAVLVVELEPMRIDLGLTDTQAGSLLSIFLLSMALFSFPASFLVDRWSRRKAMSLMAVIWSVFTYITGLGRSFLGVAIPRSLVAVGEAGFTPGGMAMITAAYPERRRSLVMGIFNIAVPLGSALGLIVGGYISAATGSWRTPFFVFAVPGIVLAVAALFLKDYKTVEELDESGRKVGFFSAAFSLFKIPTLKWLYLGFAMQNVMAFSFLTWAPAFLMRARGITEDKAGLSIGMIGLMAIAGSVLGGLITDAWQKKNRRARMYLPSISMFGSAALFLLAMHFNFTGFGFAVGLVFGAVLILGLPALSAVTQDVVTPGNKGVAWGMNIFCMYALGGGWAPLLVGKLSDSLGGGAYGLKVGLMISSVGGVLAGILYYISARHYPEDVDRVADVRLEAE